MLTASPWSAEHYTLKPLQAMLTIAANICMNPNTRRHPRTHSHTHAHTYSQTILGTWLFTCTQIQTCVHHWNRIHRRTIRYRQQSSLCPVSGSFFPLLRFENHGSQITLPSRRPLPVNIPPEHHTHSSVMAQGSYPEPSFKNLEPQSNHF